MHKLISTGAIAVLLGGCALLGKHYPPPPPGLTAEEAADRLEESKREYDTCIQNREPGRPTCDRLEDLYERDKSNYEALSH